MDALDNLPAYVEDVWYQHDDGTWSRHIRGIGDEWLDVTSYFDVLTGPPRLGSNKTGVLVMPIHLRRIHANA